VARPRLIAIGGPTACGKTAYAVNLALQLKTEVISADSRQFYKEMRIGTARPSMEELCGVPHHFLGFLSITEPYTAGRFEEEAMQLLDKLFAKHPVVIVCGGSGLFLQALLEGLHVLPSDPKLRQSLNALFHQKGLAHLVEEFKQLDPDQASKTDLKNPMRVIRALEVLKTSGASYAQLLNAQRTIRPFDIERYVLLRPRDELNNRINQRVDCMMAQGLLQEVRSLIPFRHLNALNTVGYKELFDYFDGKCSLEDAVENIKKHTRQYAKRQETWFRNQGEWKTVFVEGDELKIV